MTRASFSRHFYEKYFSSRFRSLSLLSLAFHINRRLVFLVEWHQKRFTRRLFLLLFLLYVMRTRHRNERNFNNFFRLSWFFLFFFLFFPFHFFFSLRDDEGKSEIYQEYGTWKHCLDTTLDCQKSIKVRGTLSYFQFTSPSEAKFMFTSATRNPRRLFGFSRQKQISKSMNVSRRGQF